MGFQNGRFWQVLGTLKTRNCGAPAIFGARLVRAARLQNEIAPEEYKSIRKMV